MKLLISILLGIIFLTSSAHAQKVLPKGLADIPGMYVADDSVVDNIWLPEITSLFDKIQALDAENPMLFFKQEKFLEYWITIQADPDYDGQIGGAQFTITPESFRIDEVLSNGADDAVIVQTNFWIDESSEGIITPIKCGIITVRVIPDDEEGMDYPLSSEQTDIKLMYWFQYLNQYVDEQQALMRGAKETHRAARLKK